MLSTRFTELVGCSVPIQQAGMGSLATPALAAAVANAGGLGMVSVYGDPLPQVAERLDTVRRQTTGVFGANLIMRFIAPALARATVETAAARARVVDFFYSDPDPALVARVHAQGALACWQVGSCAEAVAAVEAGCDFIIAQGIEAGAMSVGASACWPCSVRCWRPSPSRCSRSGCGWARASSRPRKRWRTPRTSTR